MDFFLFLPFFRISQRLRVLGSLAVIMFVFIITAIIVKVPLEPLPFFCLTMVKIVIINCACSQVFLIVSNHEKRQYSLIDLTPLQDSSGNLFCFFSQQHLGLCYREVYLEWLDCYQLHILLQSWAVRDSLEALQPLPWFAPLQVCCIII